MKNIFQSDICIPLKNFLTHIHIMIQFSTITIYFLYSYTLQYQKCHLLFHPNHTKFNENKWPVTTAKFYHKGTCFRSLNPSSGVYIHEVYRKMLNEFKSVSAESGCCGCRSCAAEHKLHGSASPFIHLPSGIVKSDTRKWFLHIYLSCRIVATSIQQGRPMISAHTWALQKKINYSITVTP
jgi:hypothetical protein